MEDFKKSTFEERYECLKVINVWLKYSDHNFPLIFCQAVAAMSRADEIFKKGCNDYFSLYKNASRNKIPGKK